MTLTEFHRVNADWSGEDCFVLCGGPSVIDLDLTLLQGRRVIAINTSVFTLPSADYLIFADKRWWKTWSARLRHEYRGKVVALSPMRRDPRYMLMMRVSTGGITPHPFALCIWHTTTTAAANLAVHLGVRRINFLGLDGCDRDGKSWHHDDHPADWHRYARRYECHGEALNATAAALRDIGVEAFNSNPHAAHRMFPYKPFMEMVA